MKQGILERKRRGGTRILPMKQYSDPVIEVLFDGFTAIFSHPFWCHIWEALFQELSAAGFRAVLTELNSDPETGIDKFQPAAFLVTVLVSEKMRLLNFCQPGRISSVCQSVSCPVWVSKRTPFGKIYSAFPVFFATGGLLSRNPHGHCKSDISHCTAKT